MNALKWLKDRFLERSSKIWIMQVLGLLVLINVIPGDTKTNIESAIEEGQEIYEEVADSVASAIEIGEEKIEEGKTVVQYAKDTSTRLRDIIAGLWVVIMSALGFGSKDASQGLEYEARERRFLQVMSAHGIDTLTTLSEMELPPIIR